MQLKTDVSIMLFKSNFELSECECVYSGIEPVSRGSAKVAHMYHVTFAMSRGFNILIYAHTSFHNVFSHTCCDFCSHHHRPH